LSQRCNRDPPPWSEVLDVKLTQHGRTKGGEKVIHTESVFKKQFYSRPRGALGLVNEGMEGQTFDKTCGADRRGKGGLKSRGGRASYPLVSILLSFLEGQDVGGRCPRMKGWGGAIVKKKAFSRGAAGAAGLSFSLRGGGLDPGESEEGGRRTAGGVP